MYIVLLVIGLGTLLIKRKVFTTEAFNIGIPLILHAPRCITSSRLNTQNSKKMKCYDGDVLVKSLCQKSVTIDNDSKKKGKCRCWGILCDCSQLFRGDLRICYCCELHKDQLLQPDDKKDIGKFVWVPTHKPNRYIRCEIMIRGLVPEENPYTTLG